MAAQPELDQKANPMPAQPMSPVQANMAMPAAPLTQQMRAKVEAMMSAVHNTNAKDTMPQRDASPISGTSKVGR